jgi:PAS domain S-box-containing protein
MILYQEFILNPTLQQKLSNSDLNIVNSSNKEQILVVDDTSANLKMVADFLRESGFEVRVAKSGLQALNMLKTVEPDLILLDVMMPEMDGFETCHRLKNWEKTKDIPVIFMTAVADSSNSTYKVKGLNLGAVDYISKPIQIEEVLARVTTHLHLRYLTKQLQKQKDLLASIFNESADAIFLVNIETDLITECNRRAVELFEANSKEELLNIEGQTLQKEQFTPEELSSIWDKIDIKGFWSRELEYVTKKGKLFWGNIAAKQISVAGQKMNLLRVTDVTDRKRAEEALQYSEVREREKATQIELTLKKLKCTQAQLIQAEKMSSLGRMVAGVAHELNNPVSFIYGNLTPAREYFKYLSRLIELYQQTYPNSTAEIQQLIEEIDLEFLLDDWQKLINSMQVGAERIEQIVLSLKNFSRLDESELKLVDIHEGLDNTLLILQHRLRAEGTRPEMRVIKNYSQLPLLACYASQLNQVFMSLLDNAIDSLEPQPEPRVITIRTEMGSGEWGVGNGEESSPTSYSLLPTPSVVIRIADNGRGMSEQVCQQIFDPFFTTKPVGSGTGLGLAISHQIVVEKHKGHIRCISAPGQGTELIVEIPVNLSRK